MSYRPASTDTSSDGLVEGEPLEAQPVITGQSVGGQSAGGPATIDCWSCRNIFGIPPGTPIGSILACPICQNHNRFGNSDVAQPVYATTTTTAVIAMPVDSIPMESVAVGSNFANVSRARQLLTQMKCCWIAAVVLGALMCFGGLYWGATICKNVDGTLESDCVAVVYKLYATVIVTGGCMAILGSWSLYEIRKTNIRSAQNSADPLTVDNLKWVCHLGWILGSIIFAYSLIILLGSFFVFSGLVLLVPQILTPCCCGIAIGPVVWVNCCCYQNQFVSHQLEVQLRTSRNVPLQSVQTQR